MAYGRVRNRQFRRACVLAFQVDGSDVGTSYGTAGLDIGQHLATVKKGVGADSNQVTIKLNKKLGYAPLPLLQEITVDCQARIEGVVGTEYIVVRTLELDGVTKEDDADFNVFVLSTEYGESAEGWTY